jgi:hypothetical protein
MSCPWVYELKFMNSQPELIFIALCEENEGKEWTVMRKGEFP